MEQLEIGKFLLYENGSLNTKNARHNPLKKDFEDCITR